jgi:hypothetical protein
MPTTCVSDFGPLLSPVRSLRHSFNSALANAGVSQELHQKLTGHASADLNIIYTYHELETIRSAIKTLPRLPKVEPIPPDVALARAVLERNDPSP